MKVSDYIAAYLVKKRINCNFTVPGGGAMHLNVSFGHQDGMKNVFVQHEQTAAMAAEAYYRTNNRLPLVCCTTGPGGTNTLTGVLGAWLDSIPMLIISGQVKYSATTRSTGLPLRIFGDQEFDISKLVAPVTKYAVMITDPSSVKYHLDKAIFLAEHGRPGPVWLDIPQDVQAADINPDLLAEFDEKETVNLLSKKVSDAVLDFIIDKIQSSKRPVLYAGVEIRTAGAFGVFEKVIDKLGIPVVTSFDGIDLITDDDPLYAGRAGDVGNRFGNWAVQNSDFLLVVGSRLGIRQVSYAVETWARDAFVVMVHNDPSELGKTNVHVEMPVRAEIVDFLTALDNRLDKKIDQKKEWIDKCKSWKASYPVVSESRHYTDGSPANVYWLMHRLGCLMKENTNIVSANGSACVVGASTLTIKKGQRFMINSGCASMGYEIPAAIGAAFAEPEKKVICIAGDGSIQMNLQDLQTIVFHKLNVKIFMINNAGYHSMRLTQNNLFKSFSKIGVGPESGDLGFPDMEKISSAYGIPYMKIDRNDIADEVINEMLEMEGPAFCEMFVGTEQKFEPKPSAKRLEDGTIVSPPLEDLEPFLSKDELRKIMIIPLVGEE